MGWPRYIGVKDSLSQEVGGIIAGEDKDCVPTVFIFAFPEDIRYICCKEFVINSYLECSDLLLLWLIIE